MIELLHLDHELGYALGIYHLLLRLSIPGRYTGEGQQLAFGTTWKRRRRGSGAPA